MINIIILLYLAVMFTSGFARGIGRQLWSLAVLGLSTIVAGNVYGAFSGLVIRYVHDEAGSRFLSFVLVFAVVSAIVSWPVEVIFFRSQPKREKDEGIPDRMAAGALGILEGIGLVEVASIILLTFPVFGLDALVRSSSLAYQFLRQIGMIVPLLPSQFAQVLKLLR
jgi:uncharacterized membrane protein required for colicin V production